jgi:hypothetical protein
VVVDTGSIAIGNEITIANFPPLQPVSGVLTIANFPVLQPVSIQNPLPLSIAGSVDILNFPAIQPITGSVTVLNFPAVLPTTVANFPVLQPVSVTNFPPLQPVTGTMDVSNFPALQPVSVVGGVDILDRVSRSLGHVIIDSMPPVSVGSVSVSNFPATQPVSIAASVAVTGAFFPATQPVSGSVAVSNFPATQPISGSVSVSNLPATQPISGAVDVTDRAARLNGHVTVDNFPATQPISGSVSVAATPRQSVMLSWERLTSAAAESALTNFTNGTLNAVALGAASLYTVSAGKIFRITQVNVAVRTTANQIVNTRVRIRQAASVTNSSPIIWQGELGTSNTANAAEVEYTQSFSPDGGIEIAAGQQITVTHLESGALGTVSVVLIGYEY